MKDYEINEAIALACGWKQRKVMYDGSVVGETLVPPDWKGLAGVSVPDYCNDLNAMHNAELFLTREQHPTYFRNLCPDEWAWIDHNAWPVLCFANAMQRAEAFLRTINKWKD